MLYEGGYDIIELYSANKGMNQNIAPNLLPLEYSYYIENIMPLSLGEGQVRYGNALFSDVPQDTIIEAFPFSSADGSKQQVLYFNGYNAFVGASTLRIISSNQILLTSPNFELFQKDTWLKLQYRDNNGISPVSFYEIKKIIDLPVLPDDSILIELGENSFADALEGFFIEAPDTCNPQYIDDTHFSITIPDGFVVPEYYYKDQLLKLVINNIEYDLIVDFVETLDPNTVTFTTTGDIIPAFNNGDTRILKYQSLTPEIISISNSSGYIKVLDVATNTLLGGVDQTIANLSVACLPRAEFFANLLWIYNGVDPVMTWNGVTLSIYEEQIKERASSFNRIDNKNFSFICDSSFDISKYAVGKSFSLKIDNAGNFTSVITAIIKADTLVTITSTDDLPNFTGQNKLELFYFDRPPRFSYMKSANDRLWCLGEGAVSIDYRIPDLAMRFYYSYKPFNGGEDFKFFNEKTKSVPSEDISAKHGIADNLEAIIDLSGKLVFMGRQKSQVWEGIDPLTKDSANSFAWSVTLPVGIYHGDLIVDLPNDAHFLSQNGFVSFGTLNIARQFAASNTNNMDKLAMEYINSIDSNIDYRACRSFKYKSGGFCGFKIGNNNAIVSKYHTSLFWWGIFSGDFAVASTFLSTLDDALYLYLGSTIYQYADGMNGSPILYGDRNGARFINFVETKYVNSFKKRYANKRYEIEADYSSSIVINTENKVDLYISGDLSNTFVIQNQYNLPFRGDVLGTINLVNGSTSGDDPNNPSATSIGMRLDSPSHTKKGRLKFLSHNFSVTIAGHLKDGPFNLKKIRLFGVLER
jgi:hypothetical protein